MRRLSPRLTCVLLTACFVALVIVPAAADGENKWGQVSGAMFTMQVYQGGNPIGQHVWGTNWQPSATDPNVYSWSAPAQIKGEYRDAYGNLLYKINDLSVNINVDPQVNLNFAVTAGINPLSFTLTSAVVGSFSLTNPYAFAGATVGVSDGFDDGASVTGGHNGYSYRAFTNLGTYVELSPSFSVGPFDAGTSSGNYDSSIIGTVTWMQSEFKFTLSADDSANGTSTFIISDQVIPEPASVLALGSGLVGFAGMLIRRKK